MAKSPFDASVSEATPLSTQCFHPAVTDTGATAVLMVQARLPQHDPADSLPLPRHTSLPCHISIPMPRRVSPGSTRCRAQRSTHRATTRQEAAARWRPPSQPTPPTSTDPPSDSSWPTTAPCTTCVWQSKGMQARRTATRGRRAQAPATHMQSRTSPMRGWSARRCPHACWAWDATASTQPFPWVPSRPHGTRDTLPWHNARNAYICRNTACDKSILCLRTRPGCCLNTATYTMQAPTELT